MLEEHLRGLSNSDADILDGQVLGVQFDNGSGLMDFDTVRAKT